MAKWYSSAIIMVHSTEMPSNSLNWLNTLDVHLTSLFQQGCNIKGSDVSPQVFKLLRLKPKQELFAYIKQLMSFEIILQRHLKKVELLVHFFLLVSINWYFIWFHMFPNANISNQIWTWSTNGFIQKASWKQKVPWMLALFTFPKVNFNFSLHMQENKKMHSYMHYNTKSTQVKIISGHNYLSTIGLKSWPVLHQHLV